MSILTKFEQMISRKKDTNSDKPEPAKTVSYRSLFPRNPYFPRQDPVLNRLESAVLKQAEGSLKIGNDYGLYELVMTATRKSAKQAIKEIKKENQYDPTGDICAWMPRKLYSDLSAEEVLGIKESKAKPGHCYCPLYKIDAWILGGRIAVLSGDVESAKEFFSNAKSLINKASSYPQGIAHKYAYDQREQTWRRAMKKMYKAGMLD